MKLFITLQILFCVVLPRRLATVKVKDERGSHTLELALIGAGLLVLATIVVAAIVSATKSHLAPITGDG